MEQLANQSKLVYEVFEDHKKIMESEIVLRDLGPGKTESASEIKLDKFTGVEDGQDFYTFRTKFEKKFRECKRQDAPEILKSYLAKEAYESVKEMEILEDIWDRLKRDFGDPHIMLRRKMEKIYKTANIGVRKSSSEVKDAFLSIVNCLTDVMRLVKQHKIESKLYGKHEVDDVVRHLPVWSRKAWDNEFDRMDGSSLKDEQLWVRFREFLEKQVRLQKLETERERAGKVQEGKHESKKDDVKPGHDKSHGRSDHRAGKLSSHHTNAGSSSGECPLSCGKVHGKHLFLCEKFMKIKKPSERFEMTKKLGHCFQCLDVFTRDHKGKCQDKFSCKNSAHSKYEMKNHVVICQYHCEEQANTDLFEQFKKEALRGNNWAREVKLAFVSMTSYQAQNRLVTEGQSMLQQGNNVEEEITDDPLYLLQVIEVEGRQYNVFYDDGCGGSIITKSAKERLGDRVELLSSGDIDIGGVGGISTVAAHGEYRFKLPLASGREALIVGPCMDQITHVFPTFPLSSILEEVAVEARKVGEDTSKWPSTHPYCGGDTDIMLGIRYKRYHPKEVFSLPSGLGVFESKFAGPNGSRGLVGGPSKVVSLLTQQLREQHQCNTAQNNLTSFFVDQMMLYRQGYQVDIDVKKFCFSVPNDEVETEKSEDEDIDENSLRDEDIVENSLREKNTCHITKMERRFVEYDEAGTDLNYRCPRCRGCSDCLKADKLNLVLLKEEGEQYLIENSVEVNFKDQEIKAKLPLLADPRSSLGENSRAARRIYQQQVVKLNRSPEDLESVVKSEEKMQRRGHVQYIEELDPEERKIVEGSGWSHFIPWRAVWNSNSLTTSCRIVFDLSSTTETGLSLNDISPKGINQINNLVEVFVRWRAGQESMHSDITAMYPSVKLETKYWSLQKYLWTEGLEEGVEPRVKVFKRVIYGGKSSGNLAIGGVKKLAKQAHLDYPKAAKVLEEDIYVDDILPAGQESHEACEALADELTAAVAMGGLSLKGFTFSGCPPDPDLTEDGQSIHVAGMKWFSEDDILQLDLCGKLNFSKKIRGKKSCDQQAFEIPVPLTRRQVTGKVAEVWDLVGLVTPMVARFKLDLHQLIERNLGWDDAVPPELMSDWLENLEIMKQLGELRFRRALVPIDAVGLEMETIEAGDASQSMIVIAVYVRMLRSNGQYSCQLTLAKSRLVPRGMTVPRAELLAARMNVHAGHIVHRSLGSLNTRRYRITDSEITLQWLSSWEKPLKQYVRGCVIDILRFSESQEWYWVPSEENPCDLGTRREVCLDDVGPKSEWHMGKEWMKGPEELFPIRSVEEIKLSTEKERDFKSEFAGSKGLQVGEQGLESTFLAQVIEYELENGIAGRDEINIYLAKNKIAPEVAKRLIRSKYLVDPCRFPFKKVMRIAALVFAFIRKIRKKPVVVDEPAMCAVFLHGDQTDLAAGFLIKEKVEDQSNQYKEFHRDTPELPCSHCGMKFVSSTYLSDHELTHLRKKFNSSTKTKVARIAKIEDCDLDQAWKYLFRKATEEVEYFCPPKVWKQTKKIDGVRLWTVRVLPCQEFTVGIQLSDAMLDLSPTVFCVPVVDEYSPLAWSIVLEVHWNNPSAKHAGVPTVVRYCNGLAHIYNCSQVAQAVRDSCARCNYIKKRTLGTEFGPLSKPQLQIAPPYYVAQCDLFGPYKAYSVANARQTFKVWFCVFVCITTGCTDIEVMEDYTAASFVMGYTRFSSKNGHSKMLLVDAGKNIESGGRDMEVEWLDIKYQLHHDPGVEVVVCPVGDHHQHGKVERKIRQIKETMERTMSGDRLTSLAWQTVCDSVSNVINNLPIAKGVSSMSGVKEDVGNLDLITPNRLKFGRNNDRVPVGPAYLTNDPKKLTENTWRIFEVWWKSWVDCAIPKLMDRPQGANGDRNLEVNDVVLLPRKESVLAGHYHFGVVDSVVKGDDGVVRKVVVRYRNVGEETDRFTTRGVNGLILIRRENELDIWCELFAASKAVDLQFLLNK